MDPVRSGGSQTKEESPPDGTATDTTATVQVLLPTAQAVVTFNGVTTKTTGTDRTYTTPRLVRGQTYFYDVTARWTENGNQVSRERRIRVTPGRPIVIDFTRANESGKAQRLQLK